MNYPETQIVQGIATRAHVVAGRGSVTIAGTTYRVDPVIEGLEAGSLDTVSAVRELIRENARPLVRIHFQAHPTQMIKGIGQPAVTEDVLYVTMIMVTGGCCGD